MTAVLLDTEAWWASLKHGGLLIAPSKLPQYFGSVLPPLSAALEERLRREITRYEGGDPAELLDTVFAQVLGLTHGWTKGSDVDRRWSFRDATGQLLKPRRLWQSGSGGLLPVFVAEARERLGVGRGRRVVARVVEWLRRANQKLALVTNGWQWRLVHAGADYDAWAEWDTALWFVEGQPGPQVTALRQLLGRQALEPQTAGGTAPLLAAIQDSRQGQAELSSELGERVRRAVELLVREAGAAIDPIDGAVSRRDLYIAATRLLMRLVVLLFAEARDLLPRNNPIYYQSYSVQGLRDQLVRLGGGRPLERLRQGYAAWPRLVALFRLVYAGSAHQALTIPRYGGGLFEPGDAGAVDGISRALHAFERAGLSDTVIYQILELLCLTQVRVRQGNATRLVAAPVDFSDLSSEYIGILYEGLLDYELRRADVEPIVFLNLGDQPALPLARLEQMADAQLAALVEKLKQKKKGDTEEEDSEEAGEPEESTEETGEVGVEAELEAVCDDERLRERERAYAWARRAVVAGKLVSRGRGRNAEAQYQEAIEKESRKLIRQLVLPGEWFLVRWGGTRKGSGTFYTRPQLTVPMVRRTLEPLVFDAEGRPKPPETILALKVCDPAMGSGSFLVATLRYLVNGLYESLYAYNRLQPQGDGSLCRLADGQAADGILEESLPVPLDHPEFEERLKARLKRYVVERCLYGVDLDPLAVELARLALWVETLDRSLPFSFLDHKLRCGNALVGCWFDRFAEYPAMAWEREGGDKDYAGVHHFREERVVKGKKAGEVVRKGDVWTAAIKAAKERIKGELADTIVGQQGVFDFEQAGKSAEQLHDEAMAVFEQMHALPVHETEQRHQLYRERILGNWAIGELKRAFDAWCAAWFWPGDALDSVPTPKQFRQPPEETQQRIDAIAAQYRFFHWEIEFPDVFARAGSGFDAIIGNPPWEIQKPNSQEFFTNIDPLYRTYGKQEALNKQKFYFEVEPKVEHDWLTYK